MIFRCISGNLIEINRLSFKNDEDYYKFINYSVMNK